MPTMPAVLPRSEGRLSRGDVAYAVQLMIACLLSYLATTHLVGPLTTQGNRLLGGMWAVVATIFVFKDAQSPDVSAALSRLSVRNEERLRLVVHADSCRRIAGKEDVGGVFD